MLHLVRPPTWLPWISLALCVAVLLCLAVFLGLVASRSHTDWPVTATSTGSCAHVPPWVSAPGPGHEPVLRGSAPGSRLGSGPDPLTRQRDSALRGTLHTEAGAPLGGATLLLETPDATYAIVSDDAGDFGSGPLDVEGGAGLVLASPQGWVLVDTPGPLHLQRGSTLRLHLQVRRTLHVRGLVVGSSDRMPIAGVEVSLRLGNFPAGARSPAGWHRLLAPSVTQAPVVYAAQAASHMSTSSDGRFSFQVPSPSPSEVVHAEVVLRSPAHFAEATVLKLDQDHEVVMPLRAKPRVRGRLLTADGRPLADQPLCVETREQYMTGDEAPIGWAATAPDPAGEAGLAVQVLSHRNDPTHAVQLRWIGRTNGRGEFDVALPQFGDARLSLFTANAGTFLEEFTLRQGDADRELGDRSCAPARSGWLTLRSDRGEPLSNLGLGVTLDDRFQTQVLGPEGDGSFRTDAQGRLSLAALPPDKALRLWPQWARTQTVSVHRVAVHELRSDGVLILASPDGK